MAETERDRITEQMARIAHKLLVFSGKGGVGKSTVAANLGLALSGSRRVGLMDVDIHGPNLAKLFGVEGKRMAGSETQIEPVVVSPNLKLVSMAFLLPNKDAPVIWRGPLKMKLIQQFLAEVDWGDLDYLIVDSPPGTGDEPLSVAQLIPATGAIIVTTPQELAILDSRKAVNFARRLNLPVVGIVENMSGLRCPHCGKNIDLFKEGGGERAAEEMGVPFLGRIPIDPEIVRTGDSGQPFVLSRPDSEATQAFKRVVREIIARVEEGGSR